VSRESESSRKSTARLTNAAESRIKHITKTLVDSLMANGPALGKAFCELDPERRYVVSKGQFGHALAAACNHISNEAIEFLWASQFQGQDPKATGDLDNRCADWREFMSQLANYAHSTRLPTPCCVQGSQQENDLLQRTAPITSGIMPNLDLNRPDQNAQDEVQLVADKLCHREAKLLHNPRDAAHLTEHYVENIREKASRVAKALPKRIPPGRLRSLLQSRHTVHTDDLVALICGELDNPSLQMPLPKQEPLYQVSSLAKTTHMENADVMTLDPKTIQAAINANGGDHSLDEYAGRNQQPSATPACLKLVRADIEAYVATQRVNRDREVDVEQLLANIYRPPDEQHVIHTVNDGLNRSLG